MGQELGLHCQPRGFPLTDRIAEMGGISVHDDGGEQVEHGHAVVLTLAAVREGDTLVVPKLDRLARFVPDARVKGNSAACMPRPSIPTAISPSSSQPQDQTPPAHSTGAISLSVRSCPIPESTRSRLAKLQGRIALRRRLAERFPGNPLAHLQLGSFLGDLGVQFADRMLIDEGILECRIAAGLQPDWDAPAVEPASTLVNFGEREAALRELQQAERNLPEPTPHLQFVKAYVLMTLDLYSEALACLEAVIENRAKFAPAYDLAAHSAFQSGDKIKGLLYAKEARMRGIYTEHRA